MHWDAIGAIGEILGAVGVFGTLLYLAIQIRTNSREVRDSTVLTVLDRSVANYSDALIAGIHPLVAKNVKGEKLTDDEEAIVRNFLMRNLQHAELVYLQHRAGRIEQEVMDAYNNKIRGYMTGLRRLSKPVGRWSDPLAGFTEGFKDHVRDNVMDEA